MRATPETNMHPLFEKTFDILFPPSSDELLVRKADGSYIRSLMRPQRIETTTTLLAYRDETVRALIHEAKFHHNKKALIVLGEILGSYMKAHASYENVIVIPVPLGRKRWRERGYNQVEEVLKRAGIPYQSDILRRTKETRPQTELERDERLKNVTGVFVVSDGTRVNGARVILIDDVLTTGATMHAAKAALLPHAPASVPCIALAH